MVHAKQKRVTFAAAYMNWDAILVVNLRPSELGKYHVMMQVRTFSFSALFSNTATLLHLSLFLVNQGKLAMWVLGREVSEVDRTLVRANLGSKGLFPEPSPDCGRRNSPRREWESRRIVDNRGDTYIEEVSKERILRSQNTDGVPVTDRTRHRYSIL